jgi:hypothetical protein
MYCMGTAHSPVLVDRARNESLAGPKKNKDSFSDQSVIQLLLQHPTYYYVFIHFLSFF